MSTTTTTTKTKTIAFFGATGGCGLSALKRAVAAGHTCIALCRTPSKLEASFPSPPPSNLVIRQGNAHDAESVASCLTVPASSSALSSPSSSLSSSPSPRRLVDAVNFSLGSVFIFSKMTIADPTVCRAGMAALLAALAALRAAGATGSPLLSIVSGTGIGRGTRDFPLLAWPMYHVMLKDPHADKRAMEDLVRASGERYVLVRPQLLTDGAAQPDKEIRVGVEDQATGEYERLEIGWVISREDVGRWMFENLIEGDAERYLGKAVALTW